MSDAEPEPVPADLAGVASEHPDAAAGENRARAALLDLGCEAKLVHRRFAPLYANSAFTALFGYADPAEAMAEPRLARLVDPDCRREPLEAWGALLCRGAAAGERWMRRRDGASFHARYALRPVTWGGDAAVAMAILETPAAPARPAAGRDVLAVSEDEAVLRRLRVLLGALGRRVDCADTLAEAGACAARRSYAAVFVDLDLPGWRAAERLGAPVVGVAARAAPSRLAEAAAAGMDGLVCKPFAPSELERALRLLAPTSIGAAELDPIEQEDRQHERADGDEGGHVYLPEP